MKATTSMPGMPGAQGATSMRIMPAVPRAEQGPPVARKAHGGDVEGIMALVNAFAAEELLLPRTAAQVLAAIDDYVVVRDARGRVLACAALREYSPSLAELVSVAVSRAAHGRGLGRVVVAGVERLAVKRGFDQVFAHTLAPEFFEAVGYVQADRALYPEKCARPHTLCFHRALGHAASGHAAAARAA